MAVALPCATKGSVAAVEEATVNELRKLRMLTVRTLTVRQNNLDFLLLDVPSETRPLLVS